MFSSHGDIRGHRSQAPFDSFYNRETSVTPTAARASLKTTAQITIQICLQEFCICVYCFVVKRKKKLWCYVWTEFAPIRPEQCDQPKPDIIHPSSSILTGEKTLHIIKQQRHCHFGNVMSAALRGCTCKGLLQTDVSSVWSSLHIIKGPIYENQKLIKLWK